MLQYLYFLVAAIEIYAEIANDGLVRFVSKPLLMVVLVVFYAKSVSGSWNKVHRLMVVAFCFSWVGDVALMFVYKNEIFFLVGLVGFLVTHILYTVAFADVTYKSVRGLLSKSLWVFIPLVIYMVVLLTLLVPGITGKPETKPFLIPVLVYSTAIATMVVFSINRYKRVDHKSFALVLVGALLFMFSDSIIAVNKFLHPLGSASILIMILYIAGQFLIAKGMLTQFYGTKN